MKCFTAQRRLRKTHGLHGVSLLVFRHRLSGSGGFVHRTVCDEEEIVSCAGGYNSAYRQFIYARAARISFAEVNPKRR
jgi:hypothetical protein